MEGGSWKMKKCKVSQNGFRKLRLKNEADIQPVHWCCPKAGKTIPGGHSTPFTPYAPTLPSALAALGKERPYENSRMHTVP